MKKYLSLVIIFAFFGSAGTSFGGSLEDSALPNLPTMENIREKLPAKVQTARVYMNIWPNEFSKRFSIDDAFLNIRLSGRKVFDDRIDFSGTVESDYLYGQIRRRSFNDQLQFDADYTRLRVRKWGNNYTVSGTTGFNNEPVRQVYITIYGSGINDRLRISEAGMSLTASKYTISGNFDPDKYSTKLVASLGVIIVAIQLKLDEPEEPAEK